MTQVYGKYQQRVISIQELPGLLQSPSFTLSESVGPVGRWGKWARWVRWDKWGRWARWDKWDKWGRWGLPLLTGEQGRSVGGRGAQTRATMAIAPASQ